MASETPELRFWFDPVCPFAWLTSQWVREVRGQRRAGGGDLPVQWQLISLRLLNRHIDYASHFPPEYEESHTAGLRMLRVCAAARDAHGPQALDPLYAELGAAVHERPVSESARPGTREFVTPLLAAAGLPAELADALDDEGLDATVGAETDEALSLAGKDVGTPILQFAPPAGPAFFGPVISRLPDAEQAAELWDHITGLARFPGFTELKRSLRERPQLRSMGVEPGDVGQVEDWHGGSRRQKR